MADKLEYYSVGELKKVLAEVNDDAPVVSAPLNDNVRVALDLSVAQNGKLGDYEGKIVVFTAGLFDITSGKRIILSAEEESEEENEQGND